MFENHSFMKVLNDCGILQRSFKLKFERLRFSYSAIIFGITKNNNETIS